MSYPYDDQDRELLVRVCEEMLRAKNRATGKREAVDYGTLTLEQLQQRIRQVARSINDLRIGGPELVSIVNSVFGTLSVMEVYEKLKAYNRVKMPPELRYQDFSLN